MTPEALAPMNRVGEQDDLVTALHLDTNLRDLALAELRSIDVQARTPGLFTWYEQCSKPRAVNRQRLLVAVAANKSEPKCSGRPGPVHRQRVEDGVVQAW
jgi:hypothetical protein